MTATTPGYRDDVRADDGTDRPARLRTRGIAESGSREPYTREIEAR